MKFGEYLQISHKMLEKINLATASLSRAQTDSYIVLLDWTPTTSLYEHHNRGDLMLKLQQYLRVLTFYCIFLSDNIMVITPVDQIYRDVLKKILLGKAVVKSKPSMQYSRIFPSSIHHDHV